jgi:hypothetical protein
MHSTARDVYFYETIIFYHRIYKGPKSDPVPNQFNYNAFSKIYLNITIPSGVITQTVSSAATFNPFYTHLGEKFNGSLHTNCYS